VWEIWIELTYATIVPESTAAKEEEEAAMTRVVMVPAPQQ